MKVGFIGTGSMGSILIESLIAAEALRPDQIVASNRTPFKAERLADSYPGLTAARSNAETAQACDIVFLCIKPLEFKNVIDEIKQSVRSEQIVISITSPVRIFDLEAQLPCKIAKIIPSITNFVRSGPALCMYGERIDEADRGRVESLLRAISEPMEVAERFTRVTSDIASCGPAFFAFLLERFIDAAVSETGIDRDIATRLACEMLRGTGRLLTDGGFTPETLQERVAVPGGITAQGLDLMDRELEGVFNRLIRATHDKFVEDSEKAEALLRRTND